MHSLPVFLRLTGHPVILIGEGEAAQAKRRLLQRAGAIIMGEDAEARLAIIALENHADQDAAAARIGARGILCNVVDRPELCDFTLPAIVDRDPVLIAVGTGGASAGLAKAVRQRIERMLPPTLGALATALDRAKGVLRERWPDARNRRAALDSALAEGGALDPLAPQDGDSVDRWLAAPDTPAIHRTDTIVLTSTDPDDLTLRAARLLGEADMVLHDPTVPSAILTRARADAVRAVWSADAQKDARGLTLVLRFES